MESLTMDMQKLQTPQSSGSRTLLEVVGYDVDSSFDRPITTQIANDVNQISIGGLVGLPGSNDNVLLDMCRSGIAFDLQLPVNTYIDNALCLFQPTEYQIGSMQCSFANSQYYLQQRLARSNPKKYKKQQRGLGLKLGESAKIQTDYQVPAWDNFAGNIGAIIGLLFSRYRITVPNSDAQTVYDYLSQQYPFVYLPLAIADVGALITQLNTAVSQAFLQSLLYPQKQVPLGSYISQKIQDFQQHWVNKVVSAASVLQNKTDSNIFRFFVPLSELVPQLKQFPDDVCFIGLGQQFKINCRLNNATDCVMSTLQSNVDNTDYVKSAFIDYAIQNAQLVKVFTKLDSPRVDQILRSNLIIPMQKYSTFVCPAAQSQTMVFNVSPRDRCKRILIGCHWNQSTTNISGPSTFQGIYQSSDNMKSKVSYSVEMPIQYLNFNFGGETRVFSLYQLQLLGVASVIADSQQIYADQVDCSRHYVLALDLERFADDMFGSSNAQSLNIQLQIQLQDDNLSGHGVLFAGASIFAAGSRITSLAQNFQIYAFLETQSLGAIEGGMYKMI